MGVSTLNIVAGGTHIPRQLVPYQLQHHIDDHIRVITLQKEEIPALIVQNNLLPRIDLVGVDNNVAGSCLTENFLQFHHRKTP